MKRSLNSLIVVLVFLSCNETKDVSSNPIAQEEEIVIEKEESMELPAKDTIRFLALGDSYTIGERVGEDLRWPVQLVDRLVKEGFIFEEKSPKIIARTGWTTDELQEAIDAETPSNDYSLVSLLIGVNNQYRGYNIDTYAKEFKSQLNQAITFANGDETKVFVVSIPDWGVTPFAEGRDREKIAKEIDEYNSINKEITLAAGIKYFDITPISRKAINNPELIAVDGLHPSGEMYRLWVEDILPWAKDALSK